MDIEVTLRSASIAGGMGRVLLNNGIGLDFGQHEDALEGVICAVTRSHFEAALAHHRALLAAGALPARVVIELRDDMGDLRPDRLAAYDVDRSERTGRPHFTVSSHVVFAELLARHGHSLPGYPLPGVDYWAHELVHCLDHETLSGFHEQLEADSLTGVSPWSVTGIPAPFREWELLLALSPFRAEGLAMLHGILCCGTAPALPANAAVALFRATFGAVGALVGRPFDEAADRSVDAGGVRRLYKACSDAAYLSGPAVVVDGLAVRARRDRDDRAKPLLDQVVAALGAGRPAGLSREDAAYLVRLGLGMDLGGLLAAMLDAEGPHPFGPLVALDELGPLMQFLSHEGSEEESGFVDHLRRAYAVTGGRQAWLKAVLGEIGCTMDASELAAAHAAWRQDVDRRGREHRLSSVEAEIARLVPRLWAVLERPASPSQPLAIEVARAALSYLWDPCDYIDDDARVVGLLDDLYVLRTAAALLKA